MVDLFSKEILFAPKTTGAFGKLSHSTTKNITNHIDRSRIQHVVEFGPGRGNITQEILSQLAPEAQLTCFEINETDFRPYLDQIQDERLTIHYTSCEDLPHYFDKHSIDLIISTIPLSLIDKSIAQSIISHSHTCLKPSGKFITGQYSPYADKFLTPIFGNSTRRRHFRNLPPVCILTSTKS